MVGQKVPDKRYCSKTTPIVCCWTVNDDEVGSAWPEEFVEFLIV
jgi:hypothetical protein